MMETHDLALRLKKARESVGLTLKSAADKMGFSNYQTLGSIENGAREVKAAEIIKFSKIYYCSIDVLIGTGDHNDEKPRLLWRRAPEAHVRKMIEKRVHKLAEQCVWLQEALTISSRRKFKTFVSDREEIATNFKVDDIARQARKSLDLGRRPSLSLKDALEQQMGVVVIYDALSDAGSAASMVHPRYGAIVVINSNESPWRQNYDLAHELFHLYTWELFTQDELQDPVLFHDIERKADRFASTLLLPSEEIQSRVHQKLDENKKLSKADFVDIAREFGVSTQALAYRMKNANLISWEVADRIAKDEEVLGLSKDRRWDEREKAPKSEILTDLAIRGLRKSIISRGKFAELCGIDRCDIDDFINEKGILYNDGESFEIMDS
ncbi:XRE family transcriptional regulator [Desulfatibacillum aliphaticivorans]|nr:XRE family transcriptional regulator [Desulfatibacillum aliphaticivorans]